MMKPLLVLLALLYPALAQAQLPVVPGAPLTVGMTTRAAYGCPPTQPVILHVTTLNDSGAGSLRAALTDSRPRVVVFDVSGYITLNTTVNSGGPCLTVAWQTAPSPGITVRGNGGMTETGFYIGSKDVLFQHGRIRMGSSGCNSAVQFYGGNQQRIVFDHMSVSFGQDDNIALNWTNGQSTDFTLYRSIVSEGIYRGKDGANCTGGGTSNGHAVYVGPSSGASAIVQSAFANNFERNPYMLGDTRSLILNTIIYQWHGPWGIFYNNGGVSGGSIGGPWYSTVVGNRFIAGPLSCCTGGGDDPQAYQFVYSINGVSDVKGNAIYRRDNTLAPPPANVRIVEESNQYSYNPNVSAPPPQVPLPVGFTPLASTALEDTLLPVIGARPKDRDQVDTRVIGEIKNRAGKFVHDIAEVGGFPPLAQNVAVFVPVANPHTVSPSGYTNLEVQLQQLASALEGGAAPEPPKPGPPDVPPAVGDVFVSDSFTGPAGQALTDHVGETGAAWTRQEAAIPGLKIIAVGTGTLAGTAVGDGTLTLASGHPLSAQYDVAVDIVAKTLLQGHQYGIWARSQVANPLTGLSFLYDVSSTTWSLSQFSASGFKQLGSCQRTLVAGEIVKATLRVRTGTVHAVLGSTQCTSVEGVEVVQPGLVGLSTYFTGGVPDSDTTGVHFDNFTATDVEAGPSPSFPTVTQLLVLIGVLALIIVALVVLLLRQIPETPTVRRV